VPTAPPTWLLLAGLLVVSVQWGRGLWLPRPGRWLPVASGALAVLLLPLAVIWASNGAVRWQTSYQYVDSGGTVVPQQDGVWVDGMQVSNLFVYDSAGNPLQDVQVYDDRGRPVRTTTDEGTSPWALPGLDEPWGFVPAEDEDGRARWNVYPLLGAPWDEFDWDRFGVDAQARVPADVLTTDPRVPPRPFAKAPAVVGRQPAEEPAADGPPATDPAADPATDPGVASATRDAGPAKAGSATPTAGATTAP